MLKAESVQRELNFQATPAQLLPHVTAKLTEAGATKIENDNGVLRFKLGNYWLTHYVGAAFLKKEKLPRVGAVGFQPLEGGMTKVIIQVSPIYGSSLRVGAPRKMQAAIDQSADRIVAALS